MQPLPWKSYDCTSINCAKVRLTDGDKRAYGNDDSVYITAETKAVTGVNQNAKLGIAKVTGTYTGVQNVDIDVYKAAANPLADDTAIFAVYNDKQYVIAAVVIGEDANNTDSYAYALEDAKNEYKSGDDYYWDFTAVVDGEIKTLTVKGAYGDLLDTQKTIEDSIGVNKGSMLKLTYDKDGYVIGAVLMADREEKVYGNTEAFDVNARDIDPKLDKIYNVQIERDNEGNGAKLRVTGRTLYLGGRDDYGLTLVTGAPVVVVQEEAYTKANGERGTKFTFTEYATVAQALNALADSENFEGWVSAVLNDKGTAEYVVINSADAIGIKTDDQNNKNPAGYSATVAVATRTVTLKYPAAGPMDWDKAKTAVYNALYEAGYEVVTFDLTNGVAPWALPATRAAGRPDRTPRCGRR